MRDRFCISYFIFFLNLYQHEYSALRTRRERGANLQQIQAREKREIQQTRYRHLYQARRVKGDVISQVMIGYEN